jgi:hypothetical protein
MSTIHQITTKSVDGEFIVEKFDEQSSQFDGCSTNYASDYLLSEFNDEVPQISNEEQIFYADKAWLYDHQDISFQMVGEAIYASVWYLTFNQLLAEKIVGMMIALPRRDIKVFLTSYGLFKARFLEAYWMVRTDLLGVPRVEKIPVHEPKEEPKVEVEVKTEKKVSKTQRRAKQRALKKQIMATKAAAPVEIRTVMVEPKKLTKEERKALKTEKLALMKKKHGGFAYLFTNDDRYDRFGRKI